MLSPVNIWVARAPIAPMERLSNLVIRMDAWLRVHTLRTRRLCVDSCGNFLKVGNFPPLILELLDLLVSLSNVRERRVATKLFDLTLPGNDRVYTLPLVMYLIVVITPVRPCPVTTFRVLV